LESFIVSNIAKIRAYAFEVHYHVSSPLHFVMLSTDNMIKTSSIYIECSMGNFLH